VNQTYTSHIHGSAYLQFYPLAQNQVAKINAALLGNGEQPSVLRQIAFDMPGALHIMRWLGRRAEIDIGPTKPNFSGAIELAAGID
jgi:hypothetical protein